MTVDKKVEEPEVKEVQETEKRAEVLVMNGDRKYQLLLPMNATIGEAYDAAFRVLSKVLEIAKEGAEKVRPKKVDAEEKKPEVVEK